MGSTGNIGKKEKDKGLVGCCLKKKKMWAESVKVSIRAKRRRVK